MDPRARQKFSAKERICRQQDFEQIKDKGRLLRGRRLILRYLKRDGSAKRFGVIVSKRHGKAVARNKLKRRLREIFRREKGLFPGGFDVIAIPLAVAGGSSYRQLREEMLTLVGRIKS